MIVKALIAGALRRAPHGSIKCQEDVFCASFLEAACYLGKAAPWKIVPGPWVMCVTSGGFERYVVIGGATDKDKQAIHVFESLSSYAAKNDYRV